MAQKVKVQDGKISYSTSDPAYAVEFDIVGQLNVSSEVNVGDNPLADGTISTPDNADLILQPGLNGDLRVEINGTGNILLNNVVWPTNSPNLGMFLGASGVNTLDFLSFMLSPSAPADDLTSAQLDILYPSAQNGQSVPGPNVLYQKVGLSDWRKINAIGYEVLPLAGGTMTGPLILDGDPTATFEAATKHYVDNVASGLNAHPACITSTTATLASSTGGTITYNNGVSGVGATLTTTTTWGTIGGYVVSLNDRVLIKDQTNQIQNGIYIITSSTVMTRSTDFDDSPDGEIMAGDFVYIQDGTLAGTQWIQITTEPIVGTDNIVFTQLSGAGTYTGGAGINVSGTTISNTGVLSLIAGSNINVSSATGNITVSLAANPVVNGLNFTNIPNGALTNSSITVGSTNIALGGTSTTLSGLTSVTSVDSTTTGNLIRSVQTGISAAGATLGTATDLTKDINVVSTVAASTGVSLPVEVAGLSIVVINTGANALSVYPSIGTARIDSLALGAAFSLPVGGKIMFMCISATQWYTLNATYI